LIFIGVPFMFGVLQKQLPTPPDFSSLRLCVSSSAPMPPELNRQFCEKFGIYVRQLYGSTETGTISVGFRCCIERSLESVGMPIAGVELDVYTDSGQLAQVNEIGEIAVKSPAAIESYDGCNALNQASFRNGYFFTGDVGRRGPDGLLYLTGRKKFFIEQCRGRIADFKVPSLIEFRQRFPKSPTGKIRRDLLIQENDTFQSS
jgi:long-chain acyl-CoA synthetase